MYGVGAGDYRRREDIGGIEVAVHIGRRADTHRLIRHVRMHGVGVCLGVHRDRRDTEFATGLNDPAGDLAAIGHQYSLKHGIRSVLVLLFASDPVFCNRQINGE